jgi:hypothetical protein
MNPPRPSGYRGVAINRKKRCWEAFIVINGKTRRVGRFLDADEAAEAYNEAAIKLFGPKAELNVIPETGHVST